MFFTAHNLTFFHSTCNLFFTSFPPPISPPFFLSMLLSLIHSIFILFLLQCSLLSLFPLYFSTFSPLSSLPFPLYFSTFSPLSSLPFPLYFSTFSFFLTSFSLPFTRSPHTSSRPSCISRTSTTTNLTLGHCTQKTTME